VTGAAVDVRDCPKRVSQVEQDGVLSKEVRDVGDGLSRRGVILPNPALQRTGGPVSPVEWAGLPRPPAAELYVRVRHLT
jgi:hypothetical protein